MNETGLTGLTGLTIGRLARAANVGVETVRYYQRLNLLPTPAPTHGAFRTYAPDVADRIRFIKRAQELGFTLEEIETLLLLEDGGNRKAVREVATERLAQIRDKLADLQRMESALSHLVHECAAAGRIRTCPIIEALSGR
jgi:MerR family mercuric resistance operon transcriptional regulator